MAALPQNWEDKVRSAEIMFSATFSLRIDEADGFGDHPSVAGSAPALA